MYRIFNYNYKYTDNQSINEQIKNILRVNNDRIPFEDTRLSYFTIETNGYLGQLSNDLLKELQEIKELQDIF